MTVAPWTDCPPCAACGHQWQATTEDRAKAEAAERAWEAKVDR